MKTPVELAERALRDTARLNILSKDLSVSEPGLRTVFATLKAAGLIAEAERFEMGRVVDQSYLALSRN